MIESVILALIYICVAAIVIFLVLWVLQSVIGVALPAKIVQIIWIIFALVCILILLRAVLPAVNGGLVHHSMNLLGLYA